MPLTPEELLRFRSKTREDSGCLVWTGPLDRDGYGEFHLRRKGRRAHRVAYYHAYGDIPPGMLVNHTCRNRACVNPEHLRIATAKDNTLRESESVSAINARKTHCPKGHAFDRHYGGQRSCSKCEAAKSKRLRLKWKNAPDAFKGC